MASAVATSSTWLNPHEGRPKSKPRRVELPESPRSRILKLPEVPKPNTLTRSDNGGSNTHTNGVNATGTGEFSDARDMRKRHKSNPFHMPSDTEVFAMREEERRERQEAKEQMRKLKVYDKSVVKRKNFKELLAEEPEDVAFYEQLRKRDADKILTTNQQARVDRHFGKENLHDFIAKKREMFLVQYALGVKREEMAKLEQVAQAEEQKLLDDEKALEEDAAKFDAFLKENDKNSVEAIKRAEQETKAKLEKMQDIKKLNGHIMSIRSEMSKNEDQLKDLQRYREFLEKLTPKEWLEEQQQIVDTRRKEAARKDGSDTGSVASAKRGKPNRSGKRPPATTPRGTKTPLRPTSRADTLKTTDAADTLSDTDSDTDSEDDPTHHHTTTTTTTNGGGHPTTNTNPTDQFSNYDDEAPLLYFSSPHQLLDIFAELEENNLNLIQNCQETEETLEDLRQKILETETRMTAETQSLTSQIAFLNAAIAREEEKARVLEARAKMFSSSLLVAAANNGAASSGAGGGGAAAADDASQESMLESLNVKVKEVYRRCIGDNEASLSTLSMLTAIENRLEQLFETIERMPVEKVEQAEKMKDKERRQRLREEKLEAQRQLQEERVQRALERARAPVKKKIGKPVAFRSAPPQKKKRKEEDTKKKEEEDLEYYGLLALP
ncbi:Coiled-coil domain-containing protein 38 [Gaertneriomyces sp. JEL0708]|nr:Coiled-coil domain-containing protein 38 [Gaertneriomyces sp. JEL0708]